MIPSRLVREIDRRSIMGIVFAAGNNNVECGGGRSILCINSNEGGITTAAVNRQGYVQDYSSRGPGQCSRWHPFISAPTYGVLPWGAGYRDFGVRGAGTSSATPMVSGALAVLKGMYPKADNTMLRVALAVGATHGPEVTFNTRTGFGVLQVDRALEVMPFAKIHPLYRVLSDRFIRPVEGPVKFAERVKPSK